MGIQAHWLIYKLGCIPSSLRVVYVFLLVYSHPVFTWARRFLGNPTHPPLGSFILKKLKI